jgi:hypothetical protein
LTLPLAIESAAHAQKNRPAGSYAQAVGIPLNVIVVFGDQYNGGDELYDAKITVAEVVRGEKAWQMVKAAGAGNMPPASGVEYLLARVRFEFAARAQPHHYDYTLDPRQFSAMSAATAPYQSADLAAPVKPELRGVLRSGDSVEGWVAFQIPRGDHTPLMVFREDVGSVIHQGDASIFRLYDENPAAKARPQSVCRPVSQTLTVKTMSRCMR